MRRHLPISTQEKHTGVRGGRNGSANVLQIWRNEPRVTLSHHLGLGALRQPLLAGFIMFGPDKAGNLAVLDCKERISGCVLISSVWVGGGKDDLVQDGAGPAHV